MTGPVNTDKRESDDYRKFQDVLRGLRAERRVTRAKVARTMRISHQTATRFETGERRMDLVELRLWCLAVGVPIEDVVKRFLEAVQRDL